MIFGTAVDVHRIGFTVGTAGGRCPERFTRACEFNGAIMLLFLLLCDLHLLIHIHLNGLDVLAHESVLIGVLGEKGLLRSSEEDSLVIVIVVGKVELKFVASGFHDRGTRRPIAKVC